MEIVLTMAQFNSLVSLIKMGETARGNLGIPLEIINGDQRVEMETNEVKITLED